MDRALLDSHATPGRVTHLSRYADTAGEAWKLCRRGAVPADRFGIFADPKRWGLDSLYGLWFVGGQPLRDVAALNKVETVPYLAGLAWGAPWASWRLLGADDANADLQPRAEILAR